MKFTLEQLSLVDDEPGCYRALDAENHPAYFLFFQPHGGTPDFIVFQDTPETRVFGDAVSVYCGLASMLAAKAAIELVSQNLNISPPTWLTHAKFVQTEGEDAIEVE